jgi:Trypsin
MLAQKSKRRFSAASVRLGFAVLIVAGTQLPAGATANVTALPQTTPLTQGNAKARVNPLAAPRAAAHAKALTSEETSRSRLDAAMPRAFGSFGIPYTTARVGLGAGTSTAAPTSPNFLSATYPYRASGKLLFSVAGETYFCSATVIRRGLVLTAAHCVQDFGGGSSFYRSFTFRPAHYGRTGATSAQIQPYGAWTANAVSVASSWSNGTDPGCGAARANDIAILAMQPSKNRFIADVVGRIKVATGLYSFVSSARTGNLATASVTALGYPGLIDAGRIMQRSDGPTHVVRPCGSSNTTRNLTQGSNFTGGSSGGPWIVNFGIGAGTPFFGAVPGNESEMRIVGVTSWGASDPNDPKDNYSSVFGRNSVFNGMNYGNYGPGNIGALLNAICGRRPIGSSLTYAQLGYCS